MKSVKNYSKKKSRVQRKDQRKVQPKVQRKVQRKVQMRSNKKRVNKGTKKLKRSKSRKNTKKKYQSGGKWFSLREILKGRKKSNSEPHASSPVVDDVKAIFFDVDGTLSDAHCGKKYVNYDTNKWIDLLKLLRMLKDKGVKLFILTRCFTYENICNGSEYEDYGKGVEAREYYKAIVGAMDGVFSADKIIKIGIGERGRQYWTEIKSLYMDAVFRAKFSLEKRSDVVLIDDYRENAEFAANTFGFRAFHNADNTKTYSENGGKALDMTNNVLRMLLGEDSSRNFFTQVRQVQPIEDYKIRQLKQKYPKKIKEHIETVVTQLFVAGKNFSCPPITVLGKDGNEINLNEHEFAESDFEVSREEDNQSLYILRNRVSLLQQQSKQQSKKKKYRPNNFFVLYINSLGQICIKGIKEYLKEVNDGEFTLKPDVYEKTLIFYNRIKFPDKPELTPDAKRSQVINHINENKQQFLKELYSTLKSQLERDYRYKKEFNRKFPKLPLYYQLPSLDRVLFIRPHELPEETERQKQSREAWRAWRLQKELK